MNKTPNENTTDNLVEWILDRQQQLTTITNDTDQPAYLYLDSQLNIDDKLPHIELIKKATALAAEIQQSTSANQRVLLLFQPGLDYIIAFFACLLAGVISIPAFPPNSRRRDLQRIANILIDSTPELIIGQSSVLNKLADDYQNIKRLAYDHKTYQAVYKWKKPSINSNSIAFLQYSSGSTGNPKGVMVSHGNLIHNLDVIKRQFSANNSDIGLIWLPIYHDMGLIGGILQPFHLSINTYLLSPLDVIKRPYIWLQAISKFKASISGGPNFIYQQCIDRISSEERNQLNLSSWKIAFNGAEPINDNTLKQFCTIFSQHGFSENAILTCYGLAETTLMVSGVGRGNGLTTLQVAKDSYHDNQLKSINNDNQQTMTIVSSGLVDNEHKVIIVDPESKTKLADGEIGEIWIRSQSVAKGYWNNEELSKQIFQATITNYQTDPNEKYLRTGDLGSIQQNHLYITGRRKEVLIIHGKNHYPQDIELSIQKISHDLSLGNGAAFTITVESAERLVVVQEIKRSSVRHLKPEKLFKEIQQAVSLEHQLNLLDIVFIKPATLAKTSSGKNQTFSLQKTISRQSVECY